MICVAGFLLFSVLGIFSASHRELSRQAFSCMKDKARRDPCSTGFDEEYRAYVTDQLMKIDFRLARFVRQHFAAINWILMIGFIVMTAFTAESLYNLIVHGSCDPSGGCTVNQGIGILNDLR